jgi:hypothetical protein
MNWQRPIRSLLMLMLMLMQGDRSDTVCALIAFIAGSVAVAVAVSVIHPMVDIDDGSGDACNVE